MTVKYNVTGAKRKELVELVSNFTGFKAVYKGAPSFAYEIGLYTVDKNGTLTIDERANDEIVERLLEMLYDNSLTPLTGFRQKLKDVLKFTRLLKRNFSHIRTQDGICQGVFLQKLQIVQ